MDIFINEFIGALSQLLLFSIIPVLVWLIVGRKYAKVARKSLMNLILLMTVKSVALKYLKRGLNYELWNCCLSVALNGFSPSQILKYCTAFGCFNTATF